MRSQLDPLQAVMRPGESNAMLNRSLPARIPSYPIRWFLYRNEVKVNTRALSLGGGLRTD